MTTRAAIYVRLSSHRDDDPSLSPESQEEACRAYAASQGWEVVEVSNSDLDFSASDKGMRLDRPGLASLLARLGEFDVIIARDLSRFSRSVLDFMSLVERCKAGDVALVSVKEGLDLSNAAGRMVATVLAAFAQMEAEVTGERVAAHRAAAAKIGRYAGGTVAYGYRLEDGALVPDPDEVRVIETATRMLLEDRYSLYKTVNTLNDSGVKPRRAPRWTQRTLKGVLTNPALRGLTVHRGEVVRDADGLALQPYEPVVSQEDYERLQARLVAAPGAAPRVKRAGLLSGLAVCNLCGGVLHLSVSGDRKVYRCGGRGIGRDCAGTSAKAEAMDRLVSAEFVTRYGFFREVRVIERSRDVAGLSEVIEALNATTDAMRAPGADIATLAARAGVLAQRRAEMAAQAETVVESVDTGRSIAEAWEAAGLEQRQAILADAVEGVRLDKGRRGGTGEFDAGRVAIDWRVQ